MRTFIGDRNGVDSGRARLRASFASSLLSHPAAFVPAGCSAAATVRSEAQDERRSREQSLPLRHALGEFSSFSFRLLRQRQRGDNARRAAPKGRGAQRRVIPPSPPIRNGLHQRLSLTCVREWRSGALIPEQFDCSAVMVKSRGPEPISGHSQNQMISAKCPDWNGIPKMGYTA
jgi:hypothetical protein